jgi:hypothetical protein
LRPFNKGRCRPFKKGASEILIYIGPNPRFDSPQRALVSGLKAQLLLNHA